MTRQAGENAEGNPLVLERAGLVDRRLAVDAAAGGLAVMDLARLLGKALADVVEGLLDMLAKRAQLAHRPGDGRRRVCRRAFGGQSLVSASAARDLGRHRRLGDPAVAADRADDLARGGLRVVGRAVTKPSLEDVVMGAFEVEDDHRGATSVSLFRKVSIKSRPEMTSDSPADTRTPAHAGRVAEATRRNRRLGPSPWVARFADRVPEGAPVLDLACGPGRHTRLFLARGHPVTAVDRDPGQLDVPASPRLTAIEADLEAPDGWRPAAGAFGGVVVTNYLHRPLFPALIAALAPGGVLIYETFAQGNERHGRPRNPAFLLRPGELLDIVGRDGRLSVIAFEDIEVSRPRPARIQRICAVSPPSAP